MAAGVTVSSSFTYTVRGTPGSASVTAFIDQTRHLSDLADPGGIVTPHIAPVTNVKVNGLDVHGAEQINVGTSPTVSWTWSPAQNGDPSPTYYTVELWGLFPGNTGVIAQLQATFLTSGTSLKLPSNASFIGANGWWFFKITANYEPGRDAIANPDTNHQPYAFRAQVLTQKFNAGTPPP